jgi:hypothetical protein
MPDYPLWRNRPAFNSTAVSASGADSDSASIFSNQGSKPDDFRHKPKTGFSAGFFVFPIFAESASNFFSAAFQSRSKVVMRH